METRFRDTTHSTDFLGGPMAPVRRAGAFLTVNWPSLTAFLGRTGNQSRQIYVLLWLPRIKTLPNLGSKPPPMRLAASVFPEHRGRSRNLPRQSLSLAHV